MCVCVCVHACVHGCVCMCMCVYVYIDIYIYIYIYVYSIYIYIVQTFKQANIQTLYWQNYRVFKLHIIGVLIIYYYNLYY